MADSITTFRARVLEKVPNVSTDELSNAQTDANVQQAVSQYSRLRPLEKVDEISGDGTYEYALPSDWVSDFSIFRRIEYPAGTSQDPNDDVIEPEKYCVYKTASTSVLRFFETTPTSGHTIRRTYTIRHSVTADASTVFANDFNAVCSLGAAFCCFDLARRYAQDTESLLAADSVDRRGKSGKYLEIGRGLLKEWATHMGLGEETVTAADGIKDLDLDLDGMGDFITHPPDKR